MCLYDGFIIIMIISQIFISLTLSILKLKNMSENVIPLNQAIIEAANWRALAERTLGPQDFVKAFTIPKVDFSQIIAKGAVSIRAYLGMSASGEKKLLLVGVNDKGEDMIDYKDGQFVYDFTTPCPPMCREDSPLS